MTLFSSNAAATVITFPVEPGSNTSCVAGFRVCSIDKFLVFAGSKLGALACAKIAPVFGSITITVPDLAEDFLTTSEIAFCATH